MSELAEHYGFLFLHALLLSALLAAIVSRRWTVAEKLLPVHLAGAIVLLALTVMDGQAASGGWFRVTGLSATLTVMMSLIAWIVLRYASGNLAGDPDRHRFLPWYLCVVLSASVVVSANHLVLFAAAWIALSLSLHRLLLFYPERARAALAAHKKFLLARFSETLLVVAFVLLYAQHGTGHIDEILAHYSTASAGTPVDQLIALLLVCVALIKCAQLPVHGWLVQVVEAPTPVSALLHAGVVNMGGVLLLLFAPLLGLAPLAQWVLMLVAGLSCALASLVMMTRISIKVKLAWSTIAQMGLMLLQIGLGLYHLALLHLVAHSCYKAYAFLDSGTAVTRHLRAGYVQSTFPALRHWLAAFACTVLASVLALTLLGAPALYSPYILMMIALATLLAFHFSADDGKVAASGVLLAVVSIGIYFTLSVLLYRIMGTDTVHATALADLWASAVFIGLFAAYIVLKKADHRPELRHWFIALNAGFYLDEWATRFTLRLWPITLPALRDSAGSSDQFINNISQRQS